jgi:SAM-dependent methyltransferase
MDKSMLPRNTFLRSSDYALPQFVKIREEMERIYFGVFNKKSERWGAKNPDKVGIHWSRDWEYPWAILNSDIASGMRVLDCGCGGSPLLPYLAERGCQASGVDPYIFRRMLLRTYYLDLVRQVVRRILNYNIKALGSSVSEHPRLMDTVKSSIPFLFRPNNLCGYLRDPNRMSFNISLYQESLSKMHFEDDYFDKVFCISVIEHLSVEEAHTGMREMARVLKKGGLLLVTVDNDGSHVTPQLAGGYQELIRSSGLRLDGEADFTVPNPSDVPGKYNVVGFVLRK